MPAASRAGPGSSRSFGVFRAERTPGIVAGASFPLMAAAAKDVTLHSAVPSNSTLASHAVLAGCRSPSPVCAGERQRHPICSFGAGSLRLRCPEPGGRAPRHPGPAARDTGGARPGAARHRARHQLGGGWALPDTPMQENSWRRRAPPRARRGGVLIACAGDRDAAMEALRLAGATPSRSRVFARRAAGQARTAGDLGTLSLAGGHWAWPAAVNGSPDPGTAAGRANRRRNPALMIVC